MYRKVNSLYTLNLSTPLKLSCETFAAEELWKSKMSSWRACFKLAIRVGLGLKCKRYDKDKKRLEGARKAESVHPNARTRARVGGVGRQLSVLTLRGWVGPDQEETSWAWAVWQRATEKQVGEKTVDESARNEEGGGKAVICVFTLIMAKLFNLGCPRSWQGECYGCFLGYLTDTETDGEVFHLVARILNYKKDKSLSQKQWAAIFSRRCCWTLEEILWKPKQCSKGEKSLTENADLNLLSVCKIVFIYREALNKGEMYSSFLGSQSESQMHRRIVQREKLIISCWKKKIMTNKRLTRGGKWRGGNEKRMENVLAVAKVQLKQRIWICEQ